MAVILQVDPNHPNPRHIRRAVEALRQGGIIAYPTDTSYGLGCDIFDKKAVEKIYAIKRLDKHHQLSFICSELSMLSQYAVIKDYAYRNLKRLLPGPYTFILPATRETPSFIVGKKRKVVGVRIPDQPIPRMIVEELGHPIVNTTAGVEGEGPLTSAEQIAERMGNQIEVILDIGIHEFDESSVVDLTGDVPEVIRVGKGDVSLFQA